MGSSTGYSAAVLSSAAEIRDLQALLGASGAQSDVFRNPAFFLASVQAIFLWNLFKSMRRGAIAPKNPWPATSLEWSEHTGPVVRGPYEYSGDLLVQNDSENLERSSA